MNLSDITPNVQLPEPERLDVMEFLERYEGSIKFRRMLVPAYTQIKVTVRRGDREWTMDGGYSDQERELSMVGLRDYTIRRICERLDREMGS